MVVSSARSFAARSPNAPPEKKKTKRRGFLSPLPRLYRKTRLAIRTSREKTSFSPPITLSFLSQSLSLSLSERKDARSVVSRKKKRVRRSVGRSRKEGRALLEERGLRGCVVYRKEFFSIISPLKELDESESFFCVSEESKMSHSFSFPPAHLLRP